MTQENFDRQYVAFRDQTEEALNHWLPASENVLDESMRYSLLAGGKRLRPVLTLAWCALCGGDPKAALPAAAAVEMIHTYSLIHDDLPCMDNDTLRRGRPTNHVVYGDAVALLAGSGLFNHAFETVLDQGKTAGLSETQRLESLQILCRAAGTAGILTGQVLDMKNLGDGIDRDYLIRVNRYKTAAMLSAACELGCVAAGAEDAVRTSAVEYGELLGQAFQIRDDILDVISTPEQLGKTPGKDSAEHKTTFPDLLGLDGAQDQVRILSEKAIECLPESPDADFLRMLTLRMCGREN